MIDKIEEKRQELRRLYVKYGVNSNEYKKAFEELHDLNMKFMALAYARAKGISIDNPNNPYKETKWK